MLQDTIKALNDPIRRKILEILKDKPLIVGDILKQLNITGATLSHHLKVLKDADLVTVEKEGNHSYYQINTSVMEDVLTWISSITGGKDEKK
jgi:DNA-binding transcriptional ArsR family regulator